MHLHLPTTLFLLAASTAATTLQPRQNTTTTTPPHACNNSPALCSRPYSNITHLGAHDSPFLASASRDTITFSAAGNQNLNTTAQLTAGVRLLSAQIHNNSNAWHLCHTTCGLLDAGPLTAWLASIKIWLDANPYDVVTLLLVNSDNATPAQLGKQFDLAGITRYAYTPPSTNTPLATWPSLGDMIAAQTRLVTFVADLAPASNTAAPYLLDEFTFVFENPYNVTAPTNFSCVPERPPTLAGQTATAIASGRLPLLNHFLDTNAGFAGVEMPDTGNLSTTNAATGVGSLGAAVGECGGVYGRNPSFLLVDFVDVGEGVKVVEGLNGVQVEMESAGVAKPTASGEGVGAFTGDAAGKGVGGGRGMVWAVVGMVAWWWVWLV
ncbi:hypothetical protein MMC21_008006 [Puttea exsequens]|nr:hypothetical protein [Puttea exsequens]